MELIFLIHDLAILIGALMGLSIIHSMGDKRASRVGGLYKPLKTARKWHKLKGACEFPSGFT